MKHLIIIDARGYGRGVYDIARGAVGYGTDFDPYKGFPSAQKENLPVANKIADSVICLPMHHALMDEEIQRVLDCVVKD